MMPQNNTSYNNTSFSQTDSSVEGEVLNGLVAAKQYEANRTHLSPSAQHELMSSNFDHIPQGDIAKQLTHEECLQLRSSIQTNANEQTNRTIANLRQQMTEYHALMDKLSDMTAKYEALQKTCQERDSRIFYLEQEVESLKIKQGMQPQPQQPYLQPCNNEVNNARRISYPADQIMSYAAARQQGPFHFTPQQPLPMQPPQQLSNSNGSSSSFFQPINTPLNCAPHRAPSPFSRSNIMTDQSVLQFQQQTQPQQVQQGQGLCNSNTTTQQPLRRLSTSESQLYVPTTGGSSIDCHSSSIGINCNNFNQGICNSGVYEAMPRAPRTKRTISSDHLTDDLMQMAHQGQQANYKRFKSIGAFCTPPAPVTAGLYGQFSLPKAA